MVIVEICTGQCGISTSTGGWCGNRTEGIDQCGNSRDRPVQVSVVTVETCTCQSGKQ